MADTTPSLLRDSKAYQAANKSVAAAEKKKDAYYQQHKEIIEGYYEVVSQHNDACRLRTKIMLNIAHEIPVKR